MDDIDQLLSVYRDLHPRAQQYVSALIELVEQDADGTVLSLLKRHKASERVADETWTSTPASVSRRRRESL